MTGKERARIRKDAHSLEPIFQVGKGDIGENLIDAVDKALTKRELIKMSVLETSELSAKEAAERLAEETGAEVIRVIGRRFVLYRQNPEE